MRNTSRRKRTYSDSSSSIITLFMQLLLLVCSVLKDKEKRPCFRLDRQTGKRQYNLLWEQKENVHYFSSFVVS